MRTKADLCAHAPGGVYACSSADAWAKFRRLIEFRGYARFERIKAWAGEHLAVLDALQRGRFKQASDSMRRHLTNAIKATLTGKR